MGGRREREMMFWGWTLRISGLIELGPVDEKEAMLGAGWMPTTVEAEEILAIGDLIESNMLLHRIDSLRQISIFLRG